MKNSWVTVLASGLPWIALATASAALPPGERTAGQDVFIEEVVEGSALAVAWHPSLA